MPSMLQCNILMCRNDTHVVVHRTPDIPPDCNRWSNMMKNFILAALAAVSLTAVLAPVANAGNASAVGDAQATRMQQTGSYSH
jgi:hypothetical protein